MLYLMQKLLPAKLSTFKADFSRLLRRYWSDMEYFKREFLAKVESKRDSHGLRYSFKTYTNVAFLNDAKGHRSSERHPSERRSLDRRTPARALLKSTAHSSKSSSTRSSHRQRKKKKPITVEEAVKARLTRGDGLFPSLYHLGKEN